jgi:ribosomal protein L24
MEKLKEGDIVVLLSKVEKITAIIGRLKAGMIGVVVETNPKFNRVQVYGVLINGEVYYLFEDECEKVEQQ